MLVRGTGPCGPPARRGDRPAGGPASGRAPARARGAQAERPWRVHGAPAPSDADLVAASQAGDTVPTSGPAPQAQISARINPIGTLTRGLTGIVGFTVDNRGSGPTVQVTAHVTLPAGASLLAAGTLGRASMDRAGPRRQDSASAEAWVTEVLDVANAL
jgi:hypothetical protein